jgi:hypothetical protein
MDSSLAKRRQGWRTATVPDRKRNAVSSQTAGQVCCELLPPQRGARLPGYFHVSDGAQAPRKSSTSISHPIVAPPGRQVHMEAAASAALGFLDERSIEIFRFSAGYIPTRKRFNHTRIVKRHQDAQESEAPGKLNLRVVRLGEGEGVH